MRGMVFSGPDSTRFKLSLLQYPRSSDKDDTWVTIAVQVHAPRGSWSARDTCLRADEVGRLIEWLEHAAAGQDIPATLSFLEPELTFCLTPMEHFEHSQHVLRVLLAYHLRPAWAPPDTCGDLWLDFPVTAHDLRSAAHDLRAQQASFCR